MTQTDTTIIAIAADHAGFPLKQHILRTLQEQGYTVLDLGTDSGDSVDYPDFAQKAAHAVLNKKAGKAVVICGTGIGISIAANRFKGIRCALCGDVETARLSRQHNDANILAMAGRVIAPSDAEAIVKAFLETEFEGGRHLNRIIKIDNPA